MALFLKLVIYRYLKFSMVSGGIKIIIKDEIDYIFDRQGFDVFPKMLEIEQEFPSISVEDIELCVHNETQKIHLYLPNLNNKKIAISVGSRGIPNISKIIFALGKELRSLGAKPFAVPAMGSHGGATLTGQIDILNSCGINEKSINMPIVPCIETIRLGRSVDGADIYCDKNAFEADAIVVCGRIKSHTDFNGCVESGLCKMMLVGLGKREGAVSFHKFSDNNKSKVLINGTKLFLNNTKVIFALAIIDNPHNQTALIEVLLPQNILKREPELLLVAKQLMPRINVSNIDLLIIDWCGKNISGAGADPNVTGRFPSCNGKSFSVTGPKVIVALRMTKESQGNAVGLGAIDFVSKSFIEEVDLSATYSNALSSMSLSKIPMIMNNDLDAISVAAIYTGKKKFSDVRTVRIKNTLDLERIWISENIIPEVSNIYVKNYKNFQFLPDHNLSDL